MIGMTGETFQVSERIALTGDQIVALTIWGEARDQSLEGKVAVGSVIRNRLDAGRWGDTFASVCLWPWAFSCWRKEGGATNYARVMEAANRLSAGAVGDNLVLRECCWIAAGITGRWLQDVTQGADHYLTTALYASGKAPSWVNAMRVTTVLGDHTFLRERRRHG